MAVAPASWTLKKRDSGIRVLCTGKHLIQLAVGFACMLFAW